MKKRVSAMLLVAALCVGLMPMNLLAAEETEPDDAGGEISVLSVDSEADEAEESVDETEEEIVLPEDTVEVTLEEEEPVPEDDAGEETKVLTGEGSFLYEDSALTLKVKVSGNVDVPNTEEEVSWDDVMMKTSVLGKDSDTYSQMESYAEESSGDLEDLIVMTLSFLYGDTALDVSDSDVDVTVEPSQNMINDAMPEPSDEEGSSSVSVSIIEADGDEVKELDSVTVGEDDDKDDVELNGELSEDEFGVMVLSTDDPIFTVQFYANLDTIYREHHGDDKDLTVIETHTDNGAVLPKNGTTPQTSLIEIGADNKIDSESVLTQMYADEEYEFLEESTVHNMNKVEHNGDYKLVEIWKLKEGKGETSIDKDDWDVYEIESTGDGKYTKEFTNSKEAAEEDSSLIFVEDNDVFRFVYDTTSANAYLDANFYDYNIGDGNIYSSDSTSGGAWDGNGAAYLYTYVQGINTASNYSDSGTKLAFGGDDTGTSLGHEVWTDSNGVSNYLNAYWAAGLNGCTFELAKSLDTSTNMINFNDGIIAPNMFGGSAIGKETLSNNQLVFSREGDTYTLSAVSGNNGVGVDNLESFNTTPAHSNAYTNNFWPLDNMVDYEGMDIKFGSEDEYNNSTRKYFGWVGEGNLPLSDDRDEHNSYFGMNFNIEFSYTEDYVGPLEYFFFGDDDMWVFLDDKLVVDIGGVHSSVGEHVDLWDYLENDIFNEEGIATHTLNVFYTERGASGSTCYIQYTLPEVSSVTPVDDASNLIIEKEVEGTDTDQEFEFTLNLTDAGGTELSNQYSCIITNDAGLFVESTIIKNGDTFTLQDGWNIEIRNLPNGTVATVTETRVPGYSTTYEVGSIENDEEIPDESKSGTGTTAEGTVSDEGTTYIKFINSSDTAVKDVDVDGDGEYGDNGTQAKVGDTLEYKIDYVNNTGETVTVTITDVLDEGLDFVSADNEGTYDDNTRTITWVLEGVEANAPISVTFKAKVNENALKTNKIENIAKIQVNGDPEVETEPVYTPVPGKDVDADEDGSYGDSDKLVQIGDTLTYQIDYFNGYDVAADVVITDVLGPGLTYVSSDPEATYDDSTRTLTWTLSSVEALTGGSVTFKATVNSDALENLEIDNQAYVTVGDDPAVETNKVDNGVEVIEVSGEKQWEDNDNEYNSRPESITIHLLADGEPAKDYNGDEITATVTPDTEGKWTWTFTNLPEFKTVIDASTGETTKEKITYTVTEDAIPDYTLDGITGDAENGFVITNKLVAPTLTKEADEDDYQRKEDSGEEMHPGEDTEGDGWGSWDDADNNQEVLYHLKVSDLQGVANLTVHDYLEDGLDFESDTVEVTLNDGGKDTSLTEGTDYEVSEGTCSDPGCIMDGCTFEVKFEDSVFEDVSSDAYIVISYNALTDTKEEDYNDYEDDILNYSYMTYGVNPLSLRRSAVVIAETDLFGFGIYKYADEFGEEVALAGAEFVLEREDGVYATFEVETDEETGEAYCMISGWTDNEADAGTFITGEDGMIRIEGLDDDIYTITETSVPVGYEIVDETITVTIDEDGNLTVEGDSASIGPVMGHVVNVENTLILTEVSGTKTWDDNDDQDGVRSESITIRLMADGEDTGKSKTVTAADGWEWSFDNLRKYNKDGSEIVYTFIEDAVDDYSTEYDGDDVINKHTPDQTSVSVTKAWDDDDDQDAIRPESVTVQLYADGEPVEGATVTLSEENQWTDSFTGLDIYRDQGERIVYTVEEVDVPEGYESKVTPIGDSDYAYTVTNTHTPETIEISGTKTWVDNDDKEGKRPEQITVVLMADDIIVDSTKVTEADGWKWSFTDLPKYTDGVEIVYTIAENEIKDYTATYDGYNITNKYAPGETTGTPGGNGGHGGNGGGTKTGDTNNIGLWIALLVAAMAAVFAAFRLRKRS